MKIKEKINKNKFYIQAFCLPLVLMFIFAFMRGLAPFGKYNLMAIDAWGQYFPMLREAERAFFRGNTGYSFAGALGFDLAAQSAYYTNSPLWIPAFLLPGPLSPAAADMVVFIRFALAGLSFSYFLSEKFGKKDLSLVIFGCAYAFSGYTLAFINQLMWMDAVICLPLVILGIERLADGRKSGMYFAFLFLTILSNFYIGYAVCIFSVLWYILSAVVKWKNPKHFLTYTLRFFLSSIAAGLFNLPVLIPVIRAVKNTIASGMGFTGDIKTYISLPDMLMQFLPFRKTSLSYYAPNIYFGIICLVLVFFALFYKTDIKTKIAYAVLMLFMLLSFNVNILDFIWHGFHFPNQLPARQSFCFIFTALTAACAGFIALCERYRQTEKKKTAVYNTVCTLVLIEIIANSFYFMLTDLRTVSNDSILKNKTALTEFSESFTPDRDKNEFWRSEQQPARYNGGQLFGYYGISHYSSTMSEACYNFFRQAGMDIYAKNVSTEYKENPVLNSLLGVEYIINTENTCSDTCEFIKQADNMYIYENKACLNLFYLVSDSIKNVDMSLSGDAFLNDIYVKAASCGDVITEEGFDKAEFMKGFENIASSPANITEIKNRRIKGSIDAAHEGVLMISLPAADIEIYIDGGKVPVLTLAGFMGGADISAGLHSIEIKIPG